uniref:Uncharacterized protein n=1 Tax=Arundo donax TaxID=35708 RepID=A0A0A8YHE5_ARUDO
MHLSWAPAKHKYTPKDSQSNLLESYVANHS